MIRLHTWMTAVIAAGGVALCAPSSACAQIDSSIFSVKWPEGDYWAHTLDKIVLIPSTELNDLPPGSPDDLNVFAWDSTGYIRVRRDDPDPNLVFGYRFLNLSLGGDGLPGIADDLNDLAIVGSYTFGRDEDPWRPGVLLGGGSANDGHWTNQHALYGVAALDFEHRLDADRTLHIGVEYLGNRLYLPNVPLPVVRFEQRVNPDFAFTVGFPTCLATWQVGGGDFTLDAEFTLASRARLTGEFALSDAWSLFGEIEHDADGFYLDGTSDTRLFYEYSRAMAGLRWRSKFIDAQIGVGYAFGQEFTVGDELWDATGLSDANDGLAFMLTLRGTF